MYGSSVGSSPILPHAAHAATHAVCAPIAEFLPETPEMDGKLGFEILAKIGFQILAIDMGWILAIVQVIIPVLIFLVIHD